MGRRLGDQKPGEKEVAPLIAAGIKGKSTSRNCAKERKALEKRKSCSPEGGGGHSAQRKEKSGGVVFRDKGGCKLKEGGSSLEGGESGGG